MRALEIVRRFSPKTIQSKTIAVFLVAFVGGSLILTINQAITERSRTLELIVQNKVVETRLISSELAGALRWKQASLFDERLESLGLRDIDDLSNVAAIDLGGELRFGLAPRFAGQELAAMMRDLGESGLLSDEISYHVANGHLIVAAPSVYRSKKYDKLLAVGHVLTFWNIAPVQ